MLPDNRLKLVEFQLSPTTSDVERDYVLQVRQKNTLSAMGTRDLDAGLYRVINGELFKIVEGVPPGLGYP